MPEDAGQGKTSSQGRKGFYKILLLKVCNLRNENEYNGRKLFGKASANQCIIIYFIKPFIGMK